MQLPVFVPRFPPCSTIFPYTTLFRSGNQWTAPCRKAQFKVVSALRYERARLRSSLDRKSTRLNSSHGYKSYAVFCLKKKNADGLFRIEVPKQKSPSA